MGGRRYSFRRYTKVSCCHLRGGCQATASFRVLLRVATRLPLFTIIVFTTFFLFELLKQQHPLPSCKLLIIPAGLAEPPPPTPSQLVVGDERLHQFIQQSPYAVVLLRGACYGLVAHGADTAYLQPLHQTPGRKNTGRKEKTVLSIGH